MKRISLCLSIFIILFGIQDVCAQANEDLSEEKKQEWANTGPDTVQTAVGRLILPPPFATKSVTKNSKIVKWPDGEMPKAPQGFKVTKFAEDLEHPRRTYVGPNQDIFVVESNDAGKSANRITMFRDRNQDGVPEERYTFLKNLNQPYGMLILNDYFYVANVDGVVRFPYKEGQTSIDADSEKILELPAGGYNHHWTRNLIAGPDGQKLYVSVGSSSNVGEHGMDKEVRRANILEINPDGSGEKVYAAGLRNPVGMDWNPVTGELWTAVNERDKIGNNLVPDYVTSVKEDGWYGWPYSYYGNLKDPRWESDPHPEKVENAIIPDVSVGPHTASLGLTFYTKNSFPEKYRNGAFVGQHGSWNRANFSGYKVIFIPFDENGDPQEPEDFLTGFIASDDSSQVYGRPVGVTTLPDGSLLVNDDDGNVIWRVAAEK
ncbi:sorbosone dehydrogenase family protein [Gramella sp. GC03-9]|uniref:Sorbosone dehydrogenase family protein n=1 Tax=Christiangramia oceanisediminis TaxID=2920386 RepID=A0A9X2L033_9FLAO|nr:sorbosone dehydrogenase family protein [Gramella oceanisediminis]MCP9201389.1 sorbosone dehydrogenase family protein [Gramella oceanisediminis]